MVESGLKWNKVVEIDTFSQKVPVSVADRLDGEGCMDDGDKL